MNEFEIRALVRAEREGNDPRVADRITSFGNNRLFSGEITSVRPALTAAQALAEIEKHLQPKGHNCENACIAIDQVLRRYRSSRGCEVRAYR